MELITQSDAAAPQLRFDMAAHAALASHQRSGHAHYLCLVRNKLIRATPEEAVRQAFIRFLLAEVGVPPEMLEAEVPLSRFQKGVAGRMDLVVFGVDEAGKRFPALIVECKEPTQPLVDRHAEQAFDYDDIIEADLVMLTNGTELLSFAWSEGRYRELTHVPTYAAMVKGDVGDFQADAAPDPFVRQDPRDLPPAVIERYRQGNLIGADSGADLHPFLVNLIGLLDDEGQPLPAQSAPGLEVIADRGIRFTSFGSAGGSWIGYYRCLLVTWAGKEHLVNLAVHAKGKAMDADSAGKSKAFTMLNVGIDEPGESRMSLELALDRFAQKEGDAYTIWHTGALTNGRKGSVKSQEIVAFVAEHAPDLVDAQERIVLGHLNEASLLTWEQPACVAFVVNLIRYALLRDDFRRMKNQ
jgi:hypothetical protein